MRFSQKLLRRGLSGNKGAFMEIQLSVPPSVGMMRSQQQQKTELHRIEFELFGKHCPTATENFVKLCNGDNMIPPVEARETGGGGIDSPGFKDQFQPQLTYEGSSFHRVVRDFMIQGGDLGGVDTVGCNQLSVFGDTFDAPEEVAQSKFDEKGLLGTAVSAPHLNGSQFFILTADSAAHLDGTCICFGRVTRGMGIIKEVMEQVAVDYQFSPLERITIVNCGEL